MSSSSPPPGASPVPTSPPPASPPPATPPTPSNSTAPPPATPPTPSNSTAPPPATPPTPSNPTAPPPQPTAPSSPPPAASPPPSPAASSPPPPSAPSASPPPSPATPSASPPRSPATPSLAPPPSPATPSISSPPPPSPPGNSPPSKTSPPPPPPPPSSNSVSTPLVVGVAVGAVILLALLGLVCFCCRRKKRRAQPPLNYYGDDNHGGRSQNWQHNAPPPADNVVKIPPQPSPPPPFASRPPHPPPQFPFPPPPPPPPVISSSGGSSSNYSGSESLPPPPSPGLYLGFSKSTFTFEELAMATDGFSDANLLGLGGFGYVHKGILLNGKEVAIKQLKSGSLQGEREFHAEVEIISRVHHRHLVSLVGYCISGGQRLLVYEYVPNKTLDFHLHGKDQPTMGWANRLKIALGSAKGLAYLHEDCHPKIIHRDIKAANILLDFKFEAKVADFGLAKFASDNNTHISTRVMGTFGYLAPEYASSGKLTDKSDVFSFGVMLLELITGRRPVNSTQGYMDDSLVDWARPLLTRAINDGNYDALIDPRLEKNYSLNEVSHMVACAAACVRHSARRRPRMSQIVRALEGEMSLEDLNEGIKPGHSTHHGSYGSTDYDSSQYNEHMKRFRKMVLASQDHTSSEYSVPTSEYGLHPSASSSEGQQTRDMEMGKVEETEPKLQQQPVKLD